MRELILIVSLVTILGCKDRVEIVDNPKFLNLHIELSIKNREGKDLLDPYVSNSFSHKGIIVYSLEDEIKKIIDSYSNPNLISKERGFYTIHLNTGASFDLYRHVDTTGFSITFLQLSDNVVDTLKTEWKSSSNGSVYNTKLYYNGELKWEKDSVEFPINITK